jgi:hypothetical protein
MEIVDKVVTRETGEKNPYQSGGRERRVDRRRVVKVGAGSGTGSRLEGGTEEVESDSCRQRLSYTKPGLNFSIIVGESKKLGRKGKEADGNST